MRHGLGQPVMVRAVLSPKASDPWMMDDVLCKCPRAPLPNWAGDWRRAEPKTRCGSTARSGLAPTQASCVTGGFPCSMGILQAVAICGDDPFHDAAYLEPELLRSCKFRQSRLGQHSPDHPRREYTVMGPYWARCPIETLLLTCCRVAAACAPSPQCPHPIPQFLDNPAGNLTQGLRSLL
jgi:hypothetical protein